jgi:hypothetical protein
MKHDGYICNHIHTRTYMKRGEQQKILHKGSKKKVNVFITLLYPLMESNLQQARPETAMIS